MAVVGFRSRAKHLIDLTLHGERGASTGPGDVADEALRGAVAGGGQIDSPGGSCAGAPWATGRAAILFVSTRLDAAAGPSGIVSLLFPAGDLHFESTAHHRLELSAAAATCHGTGSVNGVAGFSFRLTASEGGDASSHSLRIAIWDGETGASLYDNLPSAPDDLGRTAPIVGGSVAVYSMR